MLFNPKRINTYDRIDFEKINQTYSIRPKQKFRTLEKRREFYANLDWKELEQRRKMLIKKRIEDEKRFREKRRLLLQEKTKKIERRKKENEEQEEKKNKNCLERSEKGLRKYQENVVRFLNDNNRLLVYHKMGTGKTLTAVTVSQCYLDANPDKKVIVVTPASLLDNFKKAMKEYKYIKKKENYEFYSIQAATNLLKEKKLNCENSMVIIDEAHNYRSQIKTNKEGELVKGINIYWGYRCFLRAEKLVLLTGTPIYNRPVDLTVYKVLLNYDKEKCKKKEKKKIVDVVDFYKRKSLNSLRCKLSVHDFEKNDADFPRRIEIFKTIAMKEKYEKEYLKILRLETDALKAVFPKWTEVNENQFENLMRRATQNIDNDLNLNKKLFKAIDYIQRIDTLNKSLKNEDKYKMVIYSQFRDHGIFLIKDQIPSISHQMISGTTKKSDRQKIIDLYNEGRIQILFITKAGGEGLDLKGTDIVMILEPTWNENNSEQIIARAIRYKSHENRLPERRQVKIIHLIHTTTEDRTEETKTFVDKIVDDTTKKIPSLNNLKQIQSCDLLLSTFQKTKQKVLNYYDEKLKELSIENKDNKCN